MFNCKISREVATGNVYKIILANSIKYFALTNNPMAVAKTTNEKQSGSYRITIRTLDRKEYHLTKETFNYEAISILSEFLQAKLGFIKYNEKHLDILEKLDENDKLFFKDVFKKDFLVSTEKLQNTLEQIENILKK